MLYTRALASFCVRFVYTGSYDTAYMCARASERLKCFYYFECAAILFSANIRIFIFHLSKFSNACHSFFLCFRIVLCVSPICIVIFVLSIDDSFQWLLSFLRLYLAAGLTFNNNVTGVLPLSCKLEHGSVNKICKVNKAN